MISNGDLTIYNKYFDKSTRSDKYQRTVLKSIFWNESKAYNRLQSGLTDADKVNIMIPMSSNPTRQYIPPKQFEKLNDKFNYFTISEGDRVVKGAINLEINQPNDLDEDYEAFTVTSVDTKDYGSEHMHHWKVGAR